jgi:Fe-S cluster assembly protein SufD
MALGASLARNEVRSHLGAPGADVTLNGLYLASGKQHLDNHTVIEHAVSNCTSRELYKGILDDRARGVFSGRVWVHPDAQRTDASQSNKNLLLSDDAVVDTQPQLAIYADDVKCSHGATVGQLDEDAVFYLCSRGIDRTTARGLLTYAFASEMVSLLQPPSLRETVRRVLAQRLSTGPLLEEVA